MNPSGPPKQKKFKDKVKALAKKVGKMTLTSAGGMMGGALGALYGQPVLGQGVGADLGARASRILGFGKYTVQENTVIHGNPPPTFLNTGAERQGIEVCHREFLGNVSGSVAFSSRSFPINPGCKSTFPWLNNLARNFTEYEMLGLVFEYVPTSGYVGGGTPALGAVMLSTNYNVHEPPYPDKVTLTSSEFCVTTVPADHALHPIECRARDNLTNKLLIRGDFTTVDRGLYDLGNFQVSTEGMTSAYVVGELWVTYHVRLSRPSLEHISELIDSYASLSLLGPYSGHSFTKNVLDEIGKFPKSNLGTQLRLDRDNATTEIIIPMLTFPDGAAAYLVVQEYNTGAGWPPVTFPGLYTDPLIGTHLTKYQGPTLLGEFPAMDGDTLGGMETLLSLTYIHYDGQSDGTAVAQLRGRSAAITSPFNLGPSYTFSYGLTIVKIPTYMFMNIEPLSKSGSLRAMCRQLLSEVRPGARLNDVSELETYEVVKSVRKK